MKLKNKVLWVFAGGILLVLLLFLGQQFFQARKKQIAVILSEDAVSSFCAFQEGIYDGAEDCAVSLRIIHTSALSEKAWAELLSAQKKQGCDGVLLFCPEQYYTGNEMSYAETLEQSKLPVFSITYAPAFFHGVYSDGMEQISEILSPQIKEAEQGTFGIVADTTQTKSVRIAESVEQCLKQNNAAYDWDTSSEDGSKTLLICGETDGNKDFSDAAAVIQICPEQPDYTLLTSGAADVIVTENDYGFGYQAIAYLTKRMQGKGVSFSPPELREITKENLFDAQQDALLFE